MEPDEPSTRASDLVKRLVTQDLDPLSVAELQARIVALEAEIDRVRRRIEHAERHRASADALFRR